MYKKCHCIENGQKVRKEDANAKWFEESVPYTISLSVEIRAGANFNKVPYTTISQPSYFMKYPFKNKIFFKTPSTLIFKPTFFSTVTTYLFKKM
jgi:hypothetical protein